MKNKTLTALLLCVLIPLAACGIKPKEVEPPAGAEHSEFPRIYPDPSTDPQ